MVNEVLGSPNVKRAVNLFILRHLLRFPLPSPPKIDVTVLYTMSKLPWVALTRLTQVVKRTRLINLSIILSMVGSFSRSPCMGHVILRPFGKPWL